MDKFPGEDEATILGYTCHNYTPDYKKATYVKHIENDRGKPTHIVLHLSIIQFEHTKDLMATLESFYRGVCISDGPFSWPNMNFAVFEKQVIHVAEGAILTEGGLYGVE